jgi:hypothetical protein
VLAVVVGSALLGASMPAIDSGRVDHTDATVARQLETISARLQAMVARDDPTVAPGATLRTDVSLPHRSFTKASVTTLIFECSEGGTVARWRVGDGGWTHRRLVGLPVWTDAGSLTLRSPGTHRLVFGYRFVDDRRVVTVRRFKTDAATRPTHA